MTNKFLLNALVNLFMIMISLACILQPAWSIAPTISPDTESSKDKISTATNQQEDIYRKTIIKDAVIALKSTQRALSALNKNKKEEALSELEKATGKINLLIAREPKLAFAPVDTSIMVQDININPPDIKPLILQAQLSLAKGDIQHTRHLICSLGSEVVIYVTSIPLVSYPKEIASIVQMIDKNKLEEAKTHLQTVLATLVITKHILPLPYMKAMDMLNAIDKLDEFPYKNDADIKKIRNTLAMLRSQFALATILGYGEKNKYKIIYNKLDILENKITKNEPIKEIVQSTKIVLQDLIKKEASITDSL